MYAIYIPGKRPCRPTMRVVFKCPWALTWNTTVNVHMYMHVHTHNQGLIDLKGLGATQCASYITCIIIRIVPFPDCKL
jgi:hypothetical protein